MMMYVTEKPKTRPRIGLGSFAYRYAIGCEGFRPLQPMTAVAFLEAAHKMGFEGVQLCENLNYAKLSRDELLKVKEKAAELNLFIELGMRDLTMENILFHLDMAELLSASFLRIVLGKNRPVPEEEPQKLIDSSIQILKAVLPRCRQQGVTIGLENHFDLRTPDLVRVVQAVNDPQVGMILDTTNCLGFVERPEETLQALTPYLLSVHLKDYMIKKVEAGYLITGTALGEGSLDTAGMIKQLFNLPHGLVSIVIELTVRRGEQQTPEEVLTSEQAAIERSLAYLRSFMP